jgi:UDP-N-acetylmuramyl pentapeptide phosphotransferase/UDP-N-acetylglucosamine-1-phosphate transferase
MERYSIIIFTVSFFFSLVFKSCFRHRKVRIVFSTLPEKLMGPKVHKKEKPTVLKTSVLSVRNVCIL